MSYHLLPIYDEKGEKLFETHLNSYHVGVLRKERRCRFFSPPPSMRWWRPQKEPMTAVDSNIVTLYRTCCPNAAYEKRIVVATGDPESIIRWHQAIEEEYGRWFWESGP